MKKSLSDNYLLPLRKQVIKLIEKDSTIIDFGCGRGDFLFLISKDLKKGYGYDISNKFISLALKRKESENIKNIHFSTANLLNESLLFKNVDYSIISLLLHVLPYSESISFLEKVLKTSKKTIICAFERPNDIKNNLLLFLDQRFSSHYKNFRDYKNNGYIKGLLHLIETPIYYNCYSTFDPVIKIYVIQKK